MLYRTIFALEPEMLGPWVKWIESKSLSSWDTREAQCTVAIIAQPCLTLCDPMDYRVHGILQARILEWVAVPFSRGSSQLRDWPKALALQADSLPAEPSGKPKNTEVGSLSLLQWIFPSQAMNQGLLHCRQILYQLNYQGSPFKGYFS